MQAFGYSSWRMNQSRSGVTLIELAVVVAIVGVLASLILLAAMTLRRTSHDLQCRNHLRQLSLATANYAEANNKFPFARGEEQMVGLLPWLEHKALHELIRGAADPTPFDNPPPVFRCPADLMIDPLANYIACGGKRSGSVTSDTVGFAFPGIQSETQIQDGLSNTVFYSEKLIPVPSANQHEQVNRFMTTVNKHIYSEYEFDELCLSQRNNPQLELTATEQQTLLSTCLFGTVYPPNQACCTLGGPGFAPYELGNLTNYTPSSLHGNCVNVSMGDGSTRSIPESVSEPVWQALGTVAGEGEVVHLD